MATIGKEVKQQPWPPPMQLKKLRVWADLRPILWPSFNMVEEGSASWSFSLRWKPPWPPTSRHNINLCSLVQHVVVAKYYQIARLIFVDSGMGRTPAENQELVEYLSSRIKVFVETTEMKLGFIKRKLIVVDTEPK